MVTGSIPTGCKLSSPKIMPTPKQIAAEEGSAKMGQDEIAGGGKGRKARKLSGDGGKSGKKALSARARIAVKERGGNVKQRGRLHNHP